MTFDKYFSSLKGKRIAVVGIGVSNLPLIELLLARGCSVTACDKRTPEELGDVYSKLIAEGVTLHLGSRYLDDLDYDIIFRTPGLHPKALEGARKYSAVVTSEMEAFFQVCPCPIIAVTGSDGKTTTTTLISEMLKLQGYRVHLGGNIGKPLLAEVPDMSREDIAVLELSSFQLHSMKCHPQTAVITNIAPNHLDVHPDFEDYIAAKKNIFLAQDPIDRLVLNLDNDITASFASQARSQISWFSRKKVVKNGYSCAEGKIYRNGSYFMDSADIKIPGDHNIENMMAAFAAVDGLVSEDNCRTIAKSFAGVPHRIEHIRTLRGVKFYNDSIASSPSRTIAGLRSFDQKVILIAGGHDKNIPFAPLALEILQKVKALFLTGETATKIEDAVINAQNGQHSVPIFVIDNFKQAVLAAADYAQSGDIVLLSPACSSFDKFKNFVERGNTFKKIIQELE